MKALKIALILAIFFYCITRATNVWVHAPEIVSQMQLENVRSVDWVNAARCTQLTGILLVFCKEGDVIRIEDQLLADDRGHPLLIGIVALLRETPLELYHFVIINLLINVTGILALAWMFYVLGMKWAVVVLLLSGFSFGILNFTLATDVQAATFGIYCWALAASLMACYVVSHKLSSRRFWAISFLALFLMTWVHLFRPSIATGTLIATVIALVVFPFIFSGTLKWKKSVVLAVMLLCASIIIPSKILYLRTFIWGIAPSEQRIANHGLAATLFLGLGTEPNPWGLKWDDRVAIEAAKQVQPNVIFVSEEWYSIIRSLYFQKIREAPLTVLEIYFRKLLKTLDVIFRGQWWLLVLSTFIYFFFLRAVTKQWKQGYYKELLLVNFVTSIPLFFILLIGILSNPERTYYLEHGTLAFALSFAVMANTYFIQILNQSYSNLRRQLLGRE